MKRLILAAFLITAPLGGCQSFLTSPTVQDAAVSSTNTSIQQASTVKAAGDLYVLAVRASVAYLDSGKASKATADKMEVIEAQAYKALNDARRADKAGNSPAVGAALALFNANYADLAALIPGLH